LGLIKPSAPALLNTQQCSAHETSA